MVVANKLQRKVIFNLLFPSYFPEHYMINSNFSSFFLMKRFSSKVETDEYEYNGLFNYKQLYSFCIKCFETFECAVCKYKTNCCELKVSLTKSPLAGEVS